MKSVRFYNKVTLENFFRLITCICLCQKIKQNKGNPIKRKLKGKMYRGKVSHSMKCTKQPLEKLTEFRLKKKVIKNGNYKALNKEKIQKYSK